MAYPIGSGIFSICAFLAVCVIVLLVLRHYLPIRRSPAYLVVPVFLALALPASLVLLVPIDLASSIGHSNSAIWHPSRVLLVSWRIDYWLIFVLTWYVMTCCITDQHDTYAQNADGFFQGYSPLSRRMV